MGCCSRVFVLSPCSRSAGVIIGGWRCWLSLASMSSHLTQLVNRPQASRNESCHQNDTIWCSYPRSEQAKQCKPVYRVGITCRQNTPALNWCYRLLNWENLTIYDSRAGRRLGIRATALPPVFDKNNKLSPLKLWLKSRVPRVVLLRSCSRLYNVSALGF